MPETPSSRQWYQKGVSSYYRSAGSAYSNPHAASVTAAISLALTTWPLDLSHVLDLAAGAGEVTLAVRDGASRVDGIDPFTTVAYEQAVGQPCESLSFEQIAQGALAGRSYSLVACSYAMHLAPTSLLPALCTELAQAARQLLILTPHKRPTIKEEWGWTSRGELLHDRVRLRFHTSNLRTS